MTGNLISIKDFLGKYYSELLYSSDQQKYKNTKLDTFFEQKFYIQNNKIQMIVDPNMSGLAAIISGNEIYVSKELYEHSNILITNSIENQDQNTNPRSLYNSETFSTVAYLVCQNHTMFQIVGDIDEPVYIKYKSDYETFYNSIIVIDILDNVEVEIIEEIESFSALNSVINYILHPFSNLNLTTFYQNHISALSFVYRSIISQDNSSYNHILLGNGSSNIIDENKVFTYNQSNLEFLGIVKSKNRDFHSIVCIQPTNQDYSMFIDYRNILSEKSNVTFLPIILGEQIDKKDTISISNILPHELLVINKDSEIKKYVNDIIERTTLDRMTGSKRFYDNKSNFLQIL